MQRNLQNFISKGQFAGHETFPLRLLWLKKAFDAINKEADIKMFQQQNAITHFGVGRNMALSIRYWALATNFFKEIKQKRLICPTTLGNTILSDDGLDPYLEQATTVWLAHWNIASTHELTTTAYYAFNYLNTIEFDSSMLKEGILELAKKNNWRLADATLKRDIEVFLRSYVQRDDLSHEDAAEPLLTELAIIRKARLGGWYEFVRGPKTSLHDAVFVYALNEFWEHNGNPTTLTVEQICYALGSPGRVFKLDEDSVVTRLMNIDNFTSGAWKWVDTAGLRQVQRINYFDPLTTLPLAYSYLN